MIPNRSVFCPETKFGLCFNHLSETVASMLNLPKWKPAPRLTVEAGDLLQ